MSHKKRKIHRITLREFLGDLVDEFLASNNYDTCSPSEFLKSKMVFMDGPGHELELLSIYRSGKKICIDVGDEDAK